MADFVSRAYSTLELKSVDEESRTLVGIASTPETDRMGDVVEPKGATFKLPIPLLWQHKADQPIGQVVAASVTDRGIEITARIAKGVSARIDESWALIKSGLVRGLSIGFRPTADPELIKDTFGLRFSQWEWLELSAVTIPANASASISMIKAIDTQVRAASGAGSVSVKVGTPGVTGAVVKLAKKDATTTMKPISQQITDFEATRQAKDAERAALMNAAADKGETLDAEAADQYDTLASEIKAIDAHLARLREMETSQVAQAKAVTATDTLSASAARASSRHSVSVKQNTDPGIAMARIVICKMASYNELRKGNFVPALQLAKEHYRDDERVISYLSKTAVVGGTTTDTNWATELVEPATVDFVEWLRHKTIIGRLNLQRRPFNIRTPRQTTGGAGYWVGEGKPKPLTKFHFDAVTLPYTKVAAIAVITQELARFSQPSAEAIVRDQLAAACLERLDTDLVDPDKAVSAGVNPASLTNGVTALSSSGTAAANVITDIQNLLEQFILNKQDVSGLVLIMPNTLALAASLMITANGQPQFPGLGINGGTLLGIPVVASQYAASGASYGNMVIAVDQNSVALADDGGFSVDVSTEASLQMDDAPTNDASTGTGQSLVSMFQTNSIAIRAEREIHWVKLRSTAVSYMDDVNWGSIGSPV